MIGENGYVTNYITHFSTEDSLLFYYFTKKKNRAQIPLIDATNFE
jgi:hypothetical protein